MSKPSVNHSIYGEFRFRAVRPRGHEQKFYPAYLDHVGNAEALLAACGETKCGPWTWS